MTASFSISSTCLSQIGDQQKTLQLAIGNLLANLKLRSVVGRVPSGDRLWRWYRGTHRATIADLSALDMFVSEGSSWY
jgi:hypothetical protein